MWYLGIDALFSPPLYHHLGPSAFNPHRVCTFSTMQVSTPPETGTELLDALRFAVDAKPDRLDRDAIVEWIDRVDKLDEKRGLLLVPLSGEEDDEWLVHWQWRKNVGKWLEAVSDILTYYNHL